MVTVVLAAVRPAWPVPGDAPDVRNGNAACTHGIAVLSRCAVSQGMAGGTTAPPGALIVSVERKSRPALVDNSQPCCETIASLPVALGSHAIAHPIRPYASRPASSLAHMRSSYGQDKPAMINAVQVVVPQIFQ